MTDDRDELPKLKIVSSSDAAKATDERQTDRDESTDINEHSDEGRPFGTGTGISQQSEEPRKPISPSYHELDSEPEGRTPIAPSYRESDPEPEETEPVTVSENATDSGPEGEYGSDSDTAAAESPGETKEKPKKEKIRVSKSGGFVSALRGMVSFFTVIKKDVRQEDIDAMENNFYLTPVVGGIFALVLFIEMIIISTLNYHTAFPTGLFMAAVAVATVLIGSKFLHFDGLVDFGDGLVATGDKEKCRAAMKDSKVGAGGVGVALTVTMLTIGLYSWFGPIGGNPALFFSLLFTIPASEILVKNAMVSAAGYGEAGDGMAASQVRNANGSTVVRSMMVSGILLLFFLAIVIATAWVMDELCPFALYWNGFLADFGISMFIGLSFGMTASVAVGKLMAYVAARKFGAVTGDVLGATNEISRPVIAAATLLLCLAFMRILTSI